MIVLRVVVLWTLCLASVAAAELLYIVDFADPAVQEAVAACPYAKLEKDFEGTDVLTVEVSPDKVSAHATVGVKIPVDMAALGIADIKLLGMGDVAYENVTEPRFPYNGVKFKLLHSSGGQVRHPEFFTFADGRRFGTRLWTHTEREVIIGPSPEQASLELGLQDSSGQISFKNIRFYRAGDGPSSTLRLDPMPQARYTFPRQAFRGVTSPNSFQEHDFVELQRWGVNLIRWQIKAHPRYSFTTWKEAIELKAEDDLPQVLAAGQKYGIQVVIDLHAHAGRQILESPEGHQFLIEFWEKVARRHKNHPALYGYDLLNEPHSRYLKPGYPSWPELAERTIQAIRKIDAKTPIIVECDHMATPEQIQYLPVFDHDNIIYSIHMYHPGVLTHQLNPKKQPFVSYPEEFWHKETVFPSFLAAARDFVEKTGARIYVGEFSCIRWAPGADQYLRDCIAVFEENGWDWTYHGFREFHGWSLEHSDDPSQIEPVADTARKAVLLAAFSKNHEETKP